MSSVAQAPFERQRTKWDVAFGLLSVVAGGVMLGHVALASLVSVLFLGWTLIQDSLHRRVCVVNENG